MPSHRFTFVLLAAACIAAAGVGGYFAVRQNTVPTPAAAQTAAVQTAAAPATAAPAATGVRSVENPDAPVERPAPAKTVPPPAPAAKAPIDRPAAERTRPAAKPDTVARRRSPLPLESSLPPDEATIVPPPPVASPDLIAQAAQQPPPLPAPPQPTFQELVVQPNSVVGLQLETRVSSDTARVEDRVEARVTRDVKVGDTIAIPVGSRAVGSVIQVERGGKFKERARLGIRFNTLVLPDGTRLPISTETIFRESEGPGNSAAAKVGGGAIGGAIIGAILGGAKGAAIGATAGAGAGAGLVEAGDRSTVVLSSGTPLTARLLMPVTVTIEDK
jgi:type IV secretory pathway VirB10-like protein